MGKLLTAVTSLVGAGAVASGLLWFGQRRRDEDAARKRVAMSYEIAERLLAANILVSFTNEYGTFRPVYDKGLIQTIVMGALDESA